MRDGGKVPAKYRAVYEQWRSRWATALAVWSRFTKLSEPRWCFSPAAEKLATLEQSFAMIRLVDHAVVISLRLVVKEGLQDFPVEILAHEIGHHVYAPADLVDNARLMTYVRAGLPTVEVLAPFIANLYTDLLINDRLQRQAGLDMAGVYRRLVRASPADRLWTMYMHIYEVLWSLPSNTLVTGALDEKIRCDAQLGARLVRAYARDWLGGAGRFACLCLPYLLEDGLHVWKSRLVSMPWLDAQRAGAGDRVPDGFTSVDDFEESGAIHPGNDPDLSGFGDLEGENEAKEMPTPGGTAREGGHKNKYRDPAGFVELMRSLEVDVDVKDLVIRYYRERALPHLIRFPERIVHESADPLPEGLDQWDPASPLADLDWVESVIRGPHVIPGVTTVQRVYGTTAGESPEREPVDLYLGVDCSGSMRNPQTQLSYPVLAGAVMVLSALRAGARVKATLSGEPGRFSETPDFIRDERAILRILTGYLGTGYAFGILRLKDTFLQDVPLRRPVHLLIITDHDIFYMLKEVKDGWDIARHALAAAGGGGSMVLNIPGAGRTSKDIERLRDIGWEVYLVTDQKDLVTFAREFSRKTYEQPRGA
ncbi:MAG: VWA domain-containing protein [Acidobacteria bacterium]|nr:VWA domain-containing protein [Acidobacteriota bacterium]